MQNCRGPPERSCEVLNVCKIVNLKKYPMVLRVGRILDLIVNSLFDTCTPDFIFSDVGERRFTVEKFRP